MQNFVQIFGRLRSAVIGMIHLKAMPGSPRCVNPLKEIISTACQEADIYAKAGVDGIIVENMFDVPWQRADQIGPETVACMTAACTAIRQVVPTMPLGVQVLAGCNRHALAIAKAAGLQFIRAEGYVFSHIGDEGPHHSCAAELTRYRCNIGADDVHIFTDIKKKHSSHAITSDISIGDTAMAAQLFLSDGVIISGSATGAATSIPQLSEVQHAVSIPILVGSGVTESNVKDYMTAHAMIVGTTFKMAGEISNTLDENRVKHFMAVVKELRKEMKQAGQDRTTGQDTPYWSSFQHIDSQGG